MLVLRDPMPERVWMVIREWKPREIADDAFPMSLRDYVLARAPENATWEQAYWFGVAEEVRDDFRNGGLGKFNTNFFSGGLVEEV